MGTDSEYAAHPHRVPVPCAHFLCGTYIGEAGATRTGTAGLITTASLKTGSHATSGFGVFAYYTGATDYTYSSVTTDGTTGQSTTKPNFMYNQQVLWSSGGTGKVGSDGDYYWKYTPLKYWPNEVGTTVDNQSGPAATSANANGGKLSFFAYAPYVASPIADTDGITSMTANSTPSDPILGYKVAASGPNTVDLLWGTAGNASVNVVNDANSGVTYNASGSNYAKSILPTYTLNADLTKQKTNGTVDFAFKHALAKVGGSEGLKIVLDLDDQQGGLTGGSKDDATKVTVKSITILAKAKSAVSGDDKYYQTAQTGNFNLANGNWQITSSQGTSAAAATTTYIINQDGSGSNVAGTLNSVIAEPVSWNGTWASNPVGVLASSATNVYANEAAPLVYIPGTYPELTVTVDYIVRTEDTKLDGGYSQVEQVITRTITFGSPVQLNKRYNLTIHLGLTSVKFTASVSGWDDASNTDTIYLPINVGS